MRLIVCAPLLIICCGCVHAAGRANAFHGYREKKDLTDGSAFDGEGDHSSKPNKTPPVKSEPGVTPPPSPASLVACRDLNSACADWASSGECDKNEGFMSANCPVSCRQCTPPELRASDYVGEMLVLDTEMGHIRITPLWDNAPRTAALIMDLAYQERGLKASCHFYRNEAVPTGDIGGPPYGLLQGSLAGVLRPPPREGSLPPTAGYVAMITGTTEFYISLMDHSSWADAHTVWGKVEDMEVVHKIVAQPYHEFKHPQYGTVMRMMNAELPFNPTALAPDADQLAEL